jgi:glycosyltransferase involved in cell wall biosynthesis
MRGLSVAIITFNEEANLPECLASVEGIADEILVLDSFSADRTEAIARAHPKVRFLQHAFDGHVAQKNRAAALCRNAWVLSLDADERLSPELRDEIAALEPGARAGFRMPRVTFVLGRPILHCGWYPQRRYRLFLRERGRWGGENPHDVLSVDGEGGDLRGRIVHHSFRDLADVSRTANAFSSIQAFNLHHRGQRFPRLLAVAKPLVKFLHTYVVKRGFLDGFPGLVVAVHEAYNTFLRYAKVHELSRGLVERPTNLRADYAPSPRPR